MSEPFTPDEIRAAEIEAAREEGYRAGLVEMAKFSLEYINSAPDPAFYRRFLELDEAFLTWRRQAREAIEAKSGEAR